MIGVVITEDALDEITELFKMDEIKFTSNKIHSNLYEIEIEDNTKFEYLMKIMVKYNLNKTRSN